MKKVKFFYYNGKVTSRKPNEKEKKFLEVYKDIIGFNVTIEYRQDKGNVWICEIDPDNVHYFIHDDEYAYSDGLSGGHAYSKEDALECIISQFKSDLKNYYQKFARHYNYFNS